MLFRDNLFNFFVFSWNRSFAFKNTFSAALYKNVAREGTASQIDTYGGGGGDNRPILAINGIVNK